MNSMDQMKNTRYANIIPMKELDTKEKRLYPFPIYDKLREETPVRYDKERACWDIFRYDDVHLVLKNPKLFSSRRSQGEKRESLLIMDPPKHTQMRNLVNKAFTPKVIQELEPRIAEITNGLLDEVIPNTRMDMVYDVAGPLPVIMIAELLGVPARDRQLFKAWSDVLVKGPEVNTDEAFTSVMAEKRQASDELSDYFKDILVQRRRKRENDLISLLLDAEIDGEKLSEEELLGFCILLLVAGNETTTNLIVNAIRYMTEDVPLQAHLRAHPELLPHAIEETLRFYPPIQAIGRIATRDVEIGGQKVEAGSQVISWVAAANRDGRKFAEAARFVPTRKPNPHLGFGFGIHFCLGAPLARLEARIVLGILLHRCIDIEREEGALLHPIQSPFVFGVTHFPVRFRT
ncbi:cytochrome P450 [Aneurinibacillus aneurinilyticus]|uniref:Putative cytochrome P450 n=1 Tax=Aneurinibacillus aneurinilyticus ATCC 12856 TaxID=649747 RepID=U1XYV2_ANEAE|nr:putative cytochrome P450 [Aneurinibacillus aneurinilyticus ATCC 12856]